MSQGTQAGDDNAGKTTIIEISGNGQINNAFEDTENVADEPCRSAEEAANGSAVKDAMDDLDKTETPKTPNGAMNGKTGDGPKHNGHADAKMNGDGKTELNEAVNMELVNMQPYNGIPIKKESTELDIGDPYDEYFVPVNQHKKFMRGEKLYVTQDKRRSLGSNKKKCCWGIIGVLVLGILVAICVGFIFSQESNTPVESRTFNDNKIQGAGFGGVVPTQSPRTTPAAPPPTTDISEMYLKGVVEGELTIENMQFTDGLTNSLTSEYKNLATSLEDELKMALFEPYELQKSHNIMIKVLGFKPGSVVVLYRIGWEVLSGHSMEPDPIDKEMLKTKLISHLRAHDGFLYNYRTPISSVKSNKVVNSCLLDRNGCSHDCNFNHNTMTFLCLCPPGMMLDSNAKDCIPEHLHHSEFPTEHEPSPEPAVEPEPSPEPAAEPEPSPEPSAEPEPSPEPAAEPEPSPEPAAQPEPSPEPAAQPEPSPEPAGEPSPEPAAEPEPSPGPGGESEPSPEPAAEPEPSPEPSAEPEPSPEPAAEPEPSPEPAAEPEPSPEPAAEPESSPEPAAEPEPSPEPSPEPAAEPEPSPEPSAKHEPLLEPSSEPEPAAEPVPSPEPAAEPSPEPAAVPEPSPEPAAEPSPEPAAEPSPESSIAPEPAAEPQPSAQPYPVPESSSEPSAEPEPEPRPSPEPSARYVTSDEPSPSPEPASQEPSVEHLPATEPEPSSEPISGAFPHSSTEPSPEPTPEPPSESVPMAEPEPSPEPQPSPDPSSQPGQPTEPVQPLGLAELTSPKPATDQKSSETIGIVSEATTEPLVTSKSETALEPSQKPEMVLGMSSSMDTTEAYEATSEGQEGLKIEHSVFPMESSANLQSTSEQSAKPEPSTEPTPTIKSGPTTEPDIPLEHEIFPEPKSLEFGSDSSSTSEDSASMSTSSGENPTNVNVDVNTEVDNIPNINATEGKVSEKLIDSSSLLPQMMDVGNSSNGEVKDGTKGDSHSIENGALSPVKESSSLSAEELPKDVIELSKPEEKTTTAQVDTLKTNENVEPEHTNESLGHHTTEDEANQMSLSKDLLPDIGGLSGPFEPETHSPDTSETSDSSDSSAPSELGPNIDEVDIRPSKDDERDTLEESLADNENSLDDYGDEDEKPKYFVKNKSNKDYPNKETLRKTKVDKTEISNIHQDNIADEGNKKEVIETQPTTSRTPGITISEVSQATVQEVEPEKSSPDSSIVTTIVPEISETLSVATDHEKTEPVTATTELLVANELNHSGTTQAKESLTEMNVDETTTTAIEATLMAESKEKDIAVKSDIKESTTAIETSATEPTKMSDEPSATTINATSLLSSIVTNNPPIIEAMNISIKCASGQFTCLDGNGCISMYQRCDNSSDCQDSSDEDKCQEQQCLQNFQCKNGSCLNRHYVCDGKEQCSDGSDEINCDKWTCKFDEVNCPSSKQCIPLVWKCNGVKDCADESDELNCPQD